MATMNVSLPEAMKAWGEILTKDGRYANASDYVRDLIRRDQERAARIGSMQALIEEELASGVSPRGVDEIFRVAVARSGAGPPDDDA